MKKKAILFDLDHTLYDYESVHKKSIEHVYKFIKKNIGISLQEFDNLYNISKKEIHRELIGTASSHNKVLYFQRILEKIKNTVEPNQILQLYDIYRNTTLKYMELDLGVLDLLRFIKDKNTKVGIVTDLTTHIQLRKMESLGISDYVDVLITSEEAGIEKPHPTMFLLALNKLEILSKDAVMVGDNVVKDIEGANAIGMDTILIDRDNNKKIEEIEDYRKPNYIVKNTKELSKLLKEKFV